MSSAATDSPLHGLRDDAPQAPTPKHEEPNEETKRKVERFFMFHDFEKDPLFNCVHGTEGGRNLVLCIDGTANQFSAQSSNIVEIYSRLIKLAGVQHTFYNSGIGTYAKPSFRSWKYFKQVADHTIDTAIAWNFERIVHAAYKWLSETYEPGDRIFMFGFSRGAYQVRVVAGMIEKVGLLHKGSDNQIPFAYELYASVTSNSKRKRNPKEVDARTFETPEDILCRQFKRTLCHKDVKVHFVGAWDTVSSIGLLRGKSLPETVSGMGHVCSFRHALALDECRVKFQPEYANGGLGPREGDASCDVKEVWFAGTHSDVGGGSIANPELTNFGPSLRWMIQEATKRGLRLEPTAKHWVPLPLTKSLKWFWLPLEALPIRSLSYKNEDGSTWRPHLCAGRRVQPGQRIHHTVFTRHQTPDRPYCPKATLPEGHTDWPSFFKKHNTLKDDPVIEYDPFEDAATSLLSLEDACRVLSEGDESIITPETMTQYSHSLLALRSFLEAHTSRQTSISDLINVGNILLSALDVSLRPQNATTRINTPDLKEALIQLLAGVKLTAKGDVAYGSKAADIRRWVGPITTKHNRALAIVLNHFACINQQQSDRYIQNVAFSQLDPTKIIFTTRPSTTTSTLLWDGSTQPPKDIAHVQGEYSTISRDGSHIVVARMRDISIINTTTQPPSVTQYTDDTDPNLNPSDNIRSLAFSSNNQVLATGHWNGWIKLWRREDEQWMMFKRYKGGDRGIQLPTFSRDGSKLAFKVAGGPVKLWNFNSADRDNGFNSNPIVLEDSADAYSLAWSPSGDSIVSGTEYAGMKVWSSVHGKMKGGFDLPHAGYIWCLAFRNDGRVLATGSFDQRIRIWRWDDWVKLWEFDVGERVESLAFSPDGKTLVSGGLDGALHLWNVDAVGDDQTMG
ncbi:hypothetical protein ONZ45_g12531 [Pleurotus djamor]|nr:hypothetical protein ONZ45_g12531 [Pleurotus djamor]